MSVVGFEDVLGESKGDLVNKSKETSTIDQRAVPSKKEKGIATRRSNRRSEQR